MAEPTNGRGSYRYDVFPESIGITDPDGITCRGYPWTFEQMVEVYGRLSRLIHGDGRRPVDDADRALVTAALNSLDWGFVGPGSHAMCSARSAAEHVAATVASEARADERRRWALQLRANEQTLNAFTEGGNTAGLIAYLLESTTGTAAPVAEPVVSVLIECVDAEQALVELADGPVYTAATSIERVDAEHLRLAGPRDEVIMVLVDLSFLCQITRETMREERAKLKVQPLASQSGERS